MADIAVLSPENSEVTGPLGTRPLARPSVDVSLDCSVRSITTIRTTRGLELACRLGVLAAKGVATAMEAPIIIDQYIEIYRQGGLTALNATLGAMGADHRADILAALERIGFQIEWHVEATTGTRSGIVWAGPDPRSD